MSQFLGCSVMPAKLPTTGGCSITEARKLFADLETYALNPMMDLIHNLSLSNSTHCSNCYAMLVSGMRALGSVCMDVSTEAACMRAVGESGLANQYNRCTGFGLFSTDIVPASTTATTTRPIDSTSTSTT